jgi:peptidoglycan/LPS O-acetylase OafA/YrhL
MKSENEHNYFPGVDGLRAVAVVSVMLYHLREALMPGGFLGVDVFFAISGYVVTMSLARDAAKGYSLAEFLKRFYARRILRIIPALLVCLLVTTALTVVFIPKAWLSEATQKTGLYAFFGLSNFALLSADSYFSPRPAFNPFTHTWSLAVEEQFYVFLPLILFFTLPLGRRSGWGGAIARAVLPVLCLASFVAMWWVSGTNREAAFYMLTYRFWELGAGALCFLLLQHRGGALRASPLAVHVASWAGAVLIAAAAWFANSKAAPFPWAIPAVVGTVLLLAAMTAKDAPLTPIAQLLRSRPFVFVGRLSYSLYLWHWVVYVLFRWTVGLYDLQHMAAAVALTFALAWLSYVVVEQPIRRGRWISARPKWGVIAAGLASITLFWGAASYAYTEQPKLSASVVMRNSADWYPVPQAATAKCGLTWQVQGIDQGALQTLHRPCGTPAWTKRLFVVGDSHAGAYNQMMLALAEQEHIDARIYTGAGCTYANLLRPAGENCQRFIKSATDAVLRDAQPGDIVFLASLRMPRLMDQYSESATSIRDMITWQATPGVVEERRQAYEETVALLEQFSAKGLKVIIDAPKPVFRAAPFRCADWFNRSNPMCAGLSVPRDEMLELRQPVMESLGRLAAAYPAVVVWDPFPFLCGEASCQAIAERGPLFFDGDHLSNVGNRVLLPQFATVVRSLTDEASNTTQHNGTRE